VVELNMPVAKYTLYVEDEITRRYLGSLHSNRKLLDFRVVGGADRVRGCLEDDARSGVSSSFGVVDRDFDRNAKTGWRKTSSGSQYFCLPAHEIENYLLDFDLVAQFKCPGIDPQKDSEHWRTMAREVAEKYLYSIAYNQVLADVRREFLAGYPSQIKLSTGPDHDYTVRLTGELISTEKDLLGRLQENEWISSAISRTGGIFDARELIQRTSDVVAYYQSLLASNADAWIRSFPGKEMFQAITNSMSLSDEQWLDMARFIAGLQLEKSRVPDDMKDLLSKFEA